MRYAMPQGAKIVVKANYMKIEREDASAVAERKEILEKELHRIVATLIEKYQPEKIILFGSLASGEVHEWSDVDLLVVKESKEKRLMDRVMNIMAMLNYPEVAVDIFVYTPEEIDYLLKEGSQFIAEILEQGKVLYEKAD